ncbi:hypothetical protein Tsp_04040 [Trichinella spiralis]|uniref:hypothetical protein n=1 Tax=Trichinella spiralis TaxID=6334 RepID=UPI0001EFD0CD|nr:hypothetical protein Tsp_04040 [Trichinella spiralis]
MNPIHPISKVANKSPEFLRETLQNISSSASNRIPVNHTVQLTVEHWPRNFELRSSVPKVYSTEFYLVELSHVEHFSNGSFFPFLDSSHSAAGYASLPKDTAERLLVDNRPTPPAYRLQYLTRCDKPMITLFPSHQKAAQILNTFTKKLFKCESATKPYTYTFCTTTHDTVVLGRTEES